MKSIYIGKSTNFTHFIFPLYRIKTTNFIGWPIWMESYPSGLEGYSIKFLWDSFGQKQIMKLVFETLDGKKA